MINVPLKSVFSFQPETIRTCILIGKERYFNNRRANVKEQKYTTNKSGVDLSVQGVLGEFGMLELFKTDKKHLWDTRPNNRFNDRGDFFFRHFKVDIKCPEGHHCPLQTRSENKYCASDIYALCTLSRVRTESSQTPLPDDDSDREAICTWSEHDKIEIIFQGCVSHKELFQEHHKICRWGKFFYSYPSNLLQTLEYVANSLENSTQPSSPSSPLTPLTPLTPPVIKSQSLLQSLPLSQPSSSSSSSSSIQPPQPKSKTSTLILPPRLTSPQSSILNNSGHVAENTFQTNGFELPTRKRKR